MFYFCSYVFLKISSGLHTKTMSHENGNFLSTVKSLTVKPVLSDHSKIDKTKVLKMDYRLILVKSIAECSPLEHSAILLTCIK